MSSDNVSPNGVREQGERQRAVLNRIIEVLYADRRVAGAWLSGSFGRREADEWSDFDLHVAVEDGEYERFLLDRAELYTAVGDVLLVQPEFTENPNLEGGVFQLVYFAGAIEVDWSFGTASKARKPIGHRVLFEKRSFPVVAPPALTPAERLEKLQWWRTFFWAMAPIAVKYVARGETRQAAAQTDLLSRALICLRRLIADPAGPDPWLTATNRPLEDDIDAHLPRLGSVITPVGALDVVEQLCREMMTLHDALAQLGVDVHPLMHREVDQLAAIAREVLASENFPKRRYR